MTKSIFSRLSQSPVLLVLLFATTVILFVVWQRSEATLKAPQIEGYDWMQHPNALLVVYPDKDCGCGLSTESWATLGVEHKLDVVVASKTKRPEWEMLKKEFPQQVTIVTKISPNVIKRFTPRQSVGAVWVQHGRIVRQTDGASSVNFFKGGE